MVNNKGRLSKTQHSQRAYLAAYAQCGIVSRAAEVAKINRGTVLLWRKVQEFADAEQHALDTFIGTLETEADRRGKEGWLEPVFCKGYQVGEVRKFSDQLLMFRLKRLDPEHYRERFEVGGQGGGAIPIKIIEVMRQ